MDFPEAPFARDYCSCTSCTVYYESPIPFKLTSKGRRAVADWSFKEGLSVVGGVVQTNSETPLPRQ